MDRTKTLPALLCAIATAIAFLPTALADSKDKPLSLAFLTNAFIVQTRAIDKSNIDEFWENLKKLRGH
jgi:hypothetical protein